MSATARDALLPETSALARRVVAEGRRDRAIAALGAAALILGVGAGFGEGLARAVFVPGLRIAECFIGGAALAFAWRGARRARRADPGWAARADESPRAEGTFAALCAAGTTATFRPLLEARAEVLAHEALAVPRAPSTAMPGALRSAAALGLAVVIALLPGRVPSPAALDDARQRQAAEQGRRLESVSDLSPDDRRAVRDAGRTLASVDLTRTEVAAARARVDAARGTALADVRRVAEELGRSKDLADAARAMALDDPATLRRLVEELKRRLAAGAIGPEGTNSISEAIAAAAIALRGDDPLREELGDAARRVANATGAGSAAAVGDAFSAIEKRRQAAATLTDAVITLTEGDHQRGRGTGGSVLNPSPSPQVAQGREPRGRSPRASAAPSSDDIVVRRYFGLE